MPSSIQGVIMPPTFKSESQNQQFIKTYYLLKTKIGDVLQDSNL